MISDAAKEAASVVIFGRKCTDGSGKCFFSDKCGVDGECIVAVEAIQSTMDKAVSDLWKCKKCGCMFERQSAENGMPRVMREMEDNIDYCSSCFELGILRAKLANAEPLMMAARELANKTIDDDDFCEAGIKFAEGENAG